MTVQLVFCSNCACLESAFCAMLRQMQQTYPDQIGVVELDCMAACDMAPAVLIDGAYYPGISPADLQTQIEQRVGAELADVPA
ncbi:MAG: hypothetical protein HC893_09240 [Chloroflexaceae bacterium]|nr:hypothetical protein [Chloroflexaceae bacterium]NJL34002.1 hypothetical protein [Chloroflexaceae bacterium]NJO04328.1 hypothetical protein [Chloroflexaceae bacterium]